MAAAGADGDREAAGGENGTKYKALVTKKYFHSKVEAAVEEERRRGVELLAKERLGLERARREAGAEREQLGRDREALEQQRASLQQTRAREADIVNKLQVGRPDFFD